jgi:hypothetical protein
MERMIAGRFLTMHDADTTAALIARYIVAADICVFHKNPPGPHDAVVGREGERVDPGAEGAGKPAADTAVAEGLTAGAIVARGGLAVARAAARIGVSSASLVGAMAELGMYDDKPRTSERRGSVMLSVRVANPVDEARVIATLRAAGAADIEQAQSEWHEEDWANFDSIAAPQGVGRSSH